MISHHKNILLNSRSLINIRLLVYVLAFLHIVIVATKLLSIDLTRAEDPQLRPYARLRWKLITTWFNLATLPYLVISIYCDWKEKSGRTTKLASLRHAIFTSIILPTTAFADVLFWQLWNHNRELLMPLSADTYIPLWAHHSMHTVSLIFVIFELIVVPRHRPASMAKGISIMVIFVSLYTLICMDSISRGEYIYPVLRTWSKPRLFISMMFLYISHLFYYTSQWIVIDLVWGNVLK